MQDSWDKTKRESSVSRARSLGISASDVLVALLLIGTMCLGGYFRFVGLNWDDFVRFHPDERFLTNTATKINNGMLTFTPFEQDGAQRAICNARNPQTAGVGGYFDSECSDLNPHNVGEGLYVYGTLPLFTARFGGELLNSLSDSTRWTEYGNIHLVWRAMSAICDMLTILVVFFIGLKLRNKWVAIVAALLYACAVLPIQLAHFGTADAMTTLWVTLTVLFVVRFQENGKWTDYALSGILFGAALASRFNVFPLVIAIIAAAGLRMLPMLDTRLPWSERQRALIDNFGGLVLAGVMTILSFRVLNPYAFVGPGFFGILPNHRWIEDLQRAREITSPSENSPPAWQWVGRPAYFFAWWNMVMWGMGLALGIAGWIGWIVSGWQLVRGRIGAMRWLPLFLWILVYFGWVGGNFVMSMRYYLPLYPVLALFAAAWLVEWVTRTAANPQPIRRIAPRVILASVMLLTLLWGAMFTNIYRNQATFVQASHWVWENVSGDFSMRVEGTDASVPLINIALGNAWGGENDPVGNATRLNQGDRQQYTFTAPATGLVREIYAPRIGSLTPSETSATLRFLISREDGTPLIETQLTDVFPFEPIQVGQSYRIPLDPPLAVEFGQRYQFNLELLQGNSVLTSGELMTWEGAWDEVMPADVCTMPAGVTQATNPPPGLLSSEQCNRRSVWAGLLNGFQFNLTAEDDIQKRDRMLRILDNTDYIIIGTNRRYDSHSRIPLRWNMTNRYYEALFNGELGYDLVATFQETYELGPLRVSDQHLPTYDSPEWLNELEAEEAFHVYDHPVVFVFRRSENYDPQQAQAILYSVPLTRPGVITPGYDPYNDPTLYGPVVWDVQRASESPTQLKMTSEMLTLQYNGGTWSERFDRDGLINSSQMISLIGWWLSVMLIGFAVYPILFVLTPGLADRGYAFAKFAGILIIAWISWTLASVRLPLWSPEGIRLIAVILALVSLAIFWTRRKEMIAFMREHRTLLITIEILSLVMFVAFVGVRLSNPDLWTIGYGGEKPMDFAYFNGILRSTIFPPIDPWYANGYLNYYYFGFVIVGVPTLFTGVVPSVAYNLILPTLFSALGLAAFGGAYSIVAAWKTRTPNGTITVRRRATANPYVAGVMALLMVVVFGNLDTPRVFLTAVAQVGDYDPYDSMNEFLIREYRDQHGREPSDETINALLQQAANPSFADNLRYQVAISTNIITSIGTGIGRMISNERQPFVDPQRWFWAPSRVVGEGIGNGDPSITEMPAFTFIYGDLHAHMIAMPMMLLFVGLLFNEITLAGREQRRFFARLTAIALLGGIGGLFFATNTWDYPTFMLFGVLGLGYAWWLSWREITRWSLLSVFWRVGLFLIAARLATLPYDTWFASAYNAIGLWEGAKTPLWAYLIVHGLFLFFLVSLLIWETWRWLSTARVRALRGKESWVVIGLAAIGLTLLGAIAAALLDYQAALIVLPLVLWIGMLFFRPGQSIPMQFVLVLAGLALAITLGVEVVVLAGDNGRQNMIFKFYIQVWLLFSVAAGVAAAWLWRASENWSIGLRTVWSLGAATLIFAAALFPVMATRAKAVYRLGDEIPLTLDGAAFMRYADYSEDGQPFDLHADYQIIHWLQENVQGSPVIIEGVSRGVLYYWGGRISIYTGLPSVIGWDHHQRQQRSLDPLPQLVNQRIANVNYFYNTLDIPQAWRILRNFGVSYVVVGSLENARYGAGLAKLDQMVAMGMLEVVFETPLQSTPNGALITGTARIYRVNPAAAPEILIAESSR
ncbi:MAG: DUF2298 domain-containing protein [Anaerolineae bacterium]|jgi:YYY domain-containing protein|nr:DUF2298 domain-containing protein [Anaerolineae bacterium]